MDSSAAGSLAVIPDWSGRFVTLGEDDEAGQMAVHVADPRRHPHPEGWVLLDIEQVEDAEVYTYARLDA